MELSSLYYLLYSCDFFGSLGLDTIKVQVVKKGEEVVVMEEQFLQESKKTKGRKVRKVIPWIILGLILTCVIGFFVYVNDYYRASDDVQKYLTSNDQVKVEKEGKWISFIPADREYTKGLIFYPGAKVEYTAYAQLMNEIAKEGYQCTLVKMPFNFAVFGKNYAGKVRDAYPNVKSWYISGHSLGGAMAASYIAEHSEDYEGLVLLGAYSAKDLSDCNLSVLSIYGENDLVLSRDKLKESNARMPENFTEYCIVGGNHANYADYGNQKGDGTALIDRQNQIMQTAQQISMFLN